MDQRILTQAARDFAEIDLTEDRARLAELQAEQDHINDAITRVDDRIAEIRCDLADRKGPDSRAVADALLNGADPRDAARNGPTDAELNEEIASLQAGRQELKWRYDDARSEIKKVQMAAGTKAASAARPLAEALHADLVEAAKRLANTWASLSALNSATSGPIISMHAADQAVEAIFGGDGLLRGRLVDVPQDMQSALDGLRDKAGLVGSRFLTAIPTPVSSPFLR